MKSYELAYAKFLEACGKWAEAKWNRLRLLGKEKSSGVDAKSVARLDFDALNQAQAALAQYIDVRVEHEQKHGKAK